MTPLQKELEIRTENLNKSKEDSLSLDALKYTDVPLFNKVADNISTASGIPFLEVKKEMIQMVDKPLKLLAVNIVSLFTKDGITNAISSAPRLYLHYIVKKNLANWLKERVKVVTQIKEDLEKLLEVRSLFFVGEPVYKDMEIILSHLRAAQMYLLMIEPIGTETINTETLNPVMDNIIKAQFKQDVTDAEFQSYWKMIKDRADAKVFYFIKKADNELSTVQDYLAFMEIRQKDIYKSKYMKNLLKEMESNINFLMETLGHLAQLVPIVSGTVISNFFKNSGSETLNNLIKTVKTLTGSSTLNVLNKNISAAKSSINEFTNSYPNFIIKTTATYFNSKRGVSNELLNNFIKRLETTEFPKNKIDLLVKALGWYAEIGVIRGSLYLINPSDVINFNQLGNYAQDLIRGLDSTVIPNMGEDTKALKLEDDLKKNYEKYLKLLILSNPKEIKKIQAQIRYLVGLCMQIIREDSASILIIDGIVEPLGYKAFELMMDTTVKYLQKKDVLGTDGLKILEWLQSGEFVGLIGKNGTDIPVNLMSPLLDNDKNLIQGITNLVDDITDSTIYDIQADPLIGPLNIIPTHKTPEHSSKNFYEALAEIYSDIVRSVKKWNK